MCLHFEISSVLLLRMLFPLNNAISSFSSRKILHLSDERLKREHFFRILRLLEGQNFYVLFSKILSKVQYHSYSLQNQKIFYGYYIIFKCGFSYTYINVLAIGSFIACDVGFVYNVFSLTISV